VGNRIEVVAAVIIRHGKVLLSQRPEGTHLAGTWEFPGGKREPGESHEKCLVREIREELGVSIVVGEKITSIFHRYPEQTVLLSFYRCDLVDGEPRPLAVQDCRWVALANLPTLDMPEADRPLVRMLGEAGSRDESAR